MTAEVEVDVRTSADGQLVLMHDAKVDRTTDGHGRVSRMTLEQLRTLNAGVRAGPQFAGTRIPSFAEALALTRGCIGVYVDAKSVRAGDLLAALEAGSMVQDSVVYGSARLLQELHRLRPELRLMPEAWNPIQLWWRPRRLPLRIVAMSGLGLRRTTLALARRRGLEVFVDRLHGADQPAGWQDALERGAAGIQTDKPADLIEYLRARGEPPRPAPCRR